MTTYIYDNVEVKLTGRTASKTSKIKRRSLTKTTDIEINKKLLHEITPADTDIGEWKKWVDLDVLFTID